LAAVALANLTPIFSLARLPRPETKEGLTITTKVNSIRKIEMDSYNVVHIKAAIEVTSKEKEQKVETSTYLIRGVSPQVFEPLISIAQESEVNNVFAYANDEEFIIGKFDGSDDLDIVRKVKEKAKNEGMKALERTATLVEKAIETGGLS
jgi:hypothetical protein